MTGWYEKRLHWERSRPGEIDPHTGTFYEDYVAWYDGRQAGRITLVLGNIMGETSWRWSGGYPAGYRGKPLMPNTGYVETANQACRMAEEYWFAMLAGCKPATDDDRLGQGGAD
ncbi:hypothetical protein FB480_103411 [Agrobacterium vitis]|nr:hypothetical protein FB480_103411 [Agrobacterium vitis]